MTLLRLVLSLATAVALLLPAAVVADSPSHVQIKAVDVKGENGTGLQTLTVTPAGDVIGLVAPPRYGATVKDATSEVRIYSADGVEKKKWKLKFKGQSVAAGPDGRIYVAGDGRIARFDVEGALLGEIEVPHIAELLKDTPLLRKQAEEQLKEEAASFEGTLKSFEEQKKALTAKGADKLTPGEKSQLRALELNIQSYAQIAEQYRKRTVETVLAGVTDRLRIINAIAITDKDVFIACGEQKGYGYAVWRMDLEFKNPKQVIAGLGGCCGQMDIQARGDELIVAENTKHGVGRFDRDGKRLGAFGKRGREGDGEAFGGCCNPMNCRFCGQGDILTAESEGVVKRFTAKGEYAGLVASVKLSGGCKNVAVAVSPDNSRIYFCDLPGSKILILAKKDSAASGGQ
jgi:hypothetical protein